jgi:hypothetical protein
MLSYTGVHTAAGALIAAPGASKFIRVTGYQIVGKASDCTAKLQSASTDKVSVPLPATGVGGISCPPGREPYFDCAANEALNLNLGGATSQNIGVNIQYCIMGAL